MKTVMMAVVSLDGKINRSLRSPLDWTSFEDKELFAKTAKDIGVMILGRKTFESIKEPMEGIYRIIMTLRPDKKKNVDGVLEFTDEGPKEILERLSGKGISRVLIAGGSRIYGLFLKEKLVDEVWLTLEPKVLGKGIGLVSGNVEVDLRLMELRKLNKNTLFLKYKVLK